MLFRKKCGIDLGSDTIKIADKKNKKVVLLENVILIVFGIKNRLMNGSQKFNFKLFRRLEK